LSIENDDKIRLEEACNLEEAKVEEAETRLA